jgi:hypothetical protein
MPSDDIVIDDKLLTEREAVHRLDGICEQVRQLLTSNIHPSDFNHEADSTFFKILMMATGLRNTLKDEILD